MTPHAAKPHSMTNLAGGLVQLGISAGVEINEVRCVAGGFDLRICGMAQLTTERRIDGCVTHQAIGHLRMVGRPRGIVFRQATMTRHACILSLQLLSSRSCRRQIRSAVDGCGQGWGNISKRQMLLVAEL